MSEPSTPFDFDAVFYALDGTPDSSSQHSERDHEVVTRLLDLLLDGSARPNAIGIRTLTIAKLIGHYRVSDLDLKTIADKYAITKQALSLCAKKFRKRLGLRAYWLRSDLARAHMAQAMKQSHLRRRKGKR